MKAEIKALRNWWRNINIKAWVKAQIKPIAVLLNNIPWRSMAKWAGIISILTFTFGWFAGAIAALIIALWNKIREQDTYIALFNKMVHVIYIKLFTSRAYQRLSKVMTDEELAILINEIIRHTGTDRRTAFRALKSVFASGAYKTISKKDLLSTLIELTRTQKENTAIFYYLITKLYRQKKLTKDLINRILASDKPMAEILHSASLKMVFGVPVNGAGQDENGKAQAERIIAGLGLNDEQAFIGSVGRKGRVQITTPAANRTLERYDSRKGYFLLRFQQREERGWRRYNDTFYLRMNSTSGKQPEPDSAAANKQAAPDHALLMDVGDQDLNAKEVMVNMKEEELPTGNIFELVRSRLAAENRPALVEQTMSILRKAGLKSGQEQQYAKRFDSLRRNHIGAQDTFISEVVVNELERIAKKQKQDFENPEATKQILEYSKQLKAIAQKLEAQRKAAAKNIMSIRKYQIKAASDRKRTKVWGYIVLVLYAGISKQTAEKYITFLRYVKDIRTVGGLRIAALVVPIAVIGLLIKLASLIIALQLLLPDSRKLRPPSSSS